MPSKTKDKVKTLPQMSSNNDFKKAQQSVKDFIEDFDNKIAKVVSNNETMTIKSFLQSQDTVSFLKKCKEKELSANQARLLLIEAVKFNINKQTFNNAVKDLNIFDFKKREKKVKSKISPEPKGDKREREGMQYHKDEKVVADAPTQKTLTPNIPRGAL